MNLPDELAAAMVSTGKAMPADTPAIVQAKADARKAKEDHDEAKAKADAKLAAKKARAEAKAKKAAGV